MGVMRLREQCLRLGTRSYVACRVCCDTTLWLEPTAMDNKLEHSRHNIIAAENLHSELREHTASAGFLVPPATLLCCTPANREVIHMAPFHCEHGTRWQIQVFLEALICYQLASGNTEISLSASTMLLFLSSISLWIST